MRHRYAYATFPRAYSKSFLSVLVLMLRCILYPGSHLFVTTGGKEQAAGILKEKQEDLKIQMHKTMIERAKNNNIEFIEYIKRS